MSQENVELAYPAADALNRRDLDAFLSLCDSHLEFHSRLVELEGGEPYRGHDGIRSWWENLLRVFPDFSTENEEVRDLGDMTLTRTRVRGHGHGERRALGADAMARRGVAPQEEHPMARLHERGRRPRSRRAVGVGVSQENVEVVRPWIDAFKGRRMRDGLALPRPRSLKSAR
jgi:ketosteroid isomerase-like protein